MSTQSVTEDLPVRSTQSIPAIKTLISITTPLQAHEQNAGLIPGVKAGTYLGLDCEMVRTLQDDRRLARVSIVNYHLETVYDSFVLSDPRDPVQDYRTDISGIRPSDLRKGYARDIGVVRREVKDLFQGRVLVGHALGNDLAVLGMKYPGYAIRDTSRYAGYRKFAGGTTPGLKLLCREVLGLEIQGGEHCSVVDARAALELYRKEKVGMDADIRRKFGKLMDRIKIQVKEIDTNVDALDGEVENVSDDEEEDGSQEGDVIGGTQELDIDVAKSDVVEKKKKRKKKRKHKSRTTRA